MALITFDSKDFDPRADERLDPYFSLTDTQLRNMLEPEQGICIVESEIAIKRACDCGVKPISLLINKDRLEHMHGLIKDIEALSPNCDIFVLPAEHAQKITGYALTRGVLSAMPRPQFSALSSLIQELRRIAVLEGLTDTSNVGAIIRNAAALGIDAVICAPNCADPYSRRAIRVSMGNVFSIPCLRLEGERLSDLFAQLQSNNFTSVAFALSEDALLLGSDKCSQQLLPQGRLALFLGSEGYGLSPEVLSRCDYTVCMEMAHNVDSLNVASASAIGFWELARTSTEFPHPAWEQNHRR